MTWNVEVDSSVASGRWSKRGGDRERALGGFLEPFGAESVSGVEVLSFSILRPGDRLEVLEGGFESLGEVEALCLSFFCKIPFSFGL